MQPDLAFNFLLCVFTGILLTVTSLWEWAHVVPRKMPPGWKDKENWCWRASDLLAD